MESVSYVNDNDTWDIVNLAALPIASLRSLQTDRRVRNPRPGDFIFRPGLNFSFIFLPGLFFFGNFFLTCHHKLHVHLLRVQVCNVDVVVVVVVLIVVVVPVVVVAVGIVDDVHGSIDYRQDEANKSNRGKLGEKESFFLSATTGLGRKQQQQKWKPD